MSKRTSKFERIAQDKYMTTDPAPVRRLQPFLPPRVNFVEPCAGRGDLIKSMQWYGHKCVYACDINPNRKAIEKRNALTLDKRWRRTSHARMFVTNPPWTRSIMHKLIEHLPTLLDTWLLFDSDWAYTGQAAEYLDRCSLMVATGRVHWFNARGGYENSAWYLFPHRQHTGGPRFVGLI